MEFSERFAPAAAIQRHVTSEMQIEAEYSKKSRANLPMSSHPFLAIMVDYELHPIIEYSIRG